MKQLITIFLCFIVWSDTAACDCDYGGPFLKMAPSTKLVALVKVTKHLTFNNIYDSRTPMSMEVEIVDTYLGMENRKKVIVWGDPGHLCRPYLSPFIEGQYYVIALDPGNPNSGHAEEKATDYFIWSCGAFWLTADVNKKTAVGDVDGKNRNASEITLDRLKLLLQQHRG